jgi:hypothetical protein
VEWNLRGKIEVLGEKSFSATLSTTNPTWTDPGSNPGLCGERPATNHRSHGTANFSMLHPALLTRKLLKVMWTLKK